MARHGACGKSWTGYRTEHCPASGWRAFALRPAMAGSHGDPGSEQRPVDRHGVDVETLGDALGTEAGGIEPRCLGQVLLGGQQLQVGRVVVRGVAVDVVDVLAGAGVHDETVFVDLDVLGLGDPTQADVPAGADIPAGWGTRRYLVGPELAYRLPVGAKPGSAAGVTTTPLARGAGDLGRAVDACGVHALIVQWKCCETFSGQSTGDAHRVGDHNDGRRCLSPDEMRDKGLVLDSRGIWSTKEWTPPILTPSALAARARRAEPGISGTPGPDGDIW